MSKTKEETAATVRVARDQLQELNATLKVLAEDHAVEASILDHTMLRFAMAGGPQCEVKRITIDFVQRL